MYVLLSKNWILLVKLTKPHAILKGLPLYLHPLSYVGILTLPKLPLTWPQTAGIDKPEENPLTILKKCSS